MVELNEKTALDEMKLATVKPHNAFSDNEVLDFGKLLGRPIHKSTLFRRIEITDNDALVRHPDYDGLRRITVTFYLGRFITEDNVISQHVFSNRKPYDQKRKVRTDICEKLMHQVDRAVMVAKNHRGFYDYYPSSENPSIRHIILILRDRISISSDHLL